MSLKPLPEKPHRTIAEIEEILGSGFRAPNFLGAANDACKLVRYWHAVAMRYRSQAITAMAKYDGTPRAQSAAALDAVALSEDL
jgi:hypothetical protein